jgi:pimeloyl-ACP methyl ester carboxylesterase
MAHQESWMDPRAAVEAMKQMANQTDIVIIPRAGHHVYIDNIHFFNKAVLKATREANGNSSHDE